MTSTEAKEGVKQIVNDMIAKADVNKDEVVSADELAAYLFNLADTNKDGKL